MNISQRQWLKITVTRYYGIFLYRRIKSLKLAELILFLIYNESSKCEVTDLSDSNETEKIEIYQGLAKEVKKLWNMNNELNSWSKRTPPRKLKERLET